MMSWQQLKEKYKRFKQWQKEPIVFVNSDEEHRCHCCGYTFTGNYCPCCSQKADLGRIGWKSVRQGVMDIWGLGTRSLLFSLWQLLLRPGYFISEYISGKRPVSFPPVKMLFVLAIIYVLIINWLFPDAEGLGIALEERSVELFKPFYDWYETHLSWVMLILSVLAIIPTWIMFRYAPRHTKHTLPEGFFIQILFLVLQMVISFILIPFKLIFGHYVINYVNMAIVMIYYVIGYRQLFGYGWWSTFWRQAFIFLFIVNVGVVLALLAFDMNDPNDPGVPVAPDVVLPTTTFMIIFFSIFSVLILACGFIFNRIATRKVRKQLKQ